MIGDLPFANVRPPENILFVCKLNAVTQDEDLELIFSRFGKILSCEVIRDKKTGDSLQYAFIEFDRQEDAEQVCRFARSSNLPHQDLIGRRHSSYRLTSRCRTFSSTTGAFGSTFPSQSRSSEARGVMRPCAYKLPAADGEAEAAEVEVVAAAAVASSRGEGGPTWASSSTTGTSRGVDPTDAKLLTLRRPGVGAGAQTDGKEEEVEEEEEAGTTVDREIRATTGEAAAPSATTGGAAAVAATAPTGPATSGGELSNAMIRPSSVFP